MIVFYSILFFLLLLIAIIDYATSEIPDALNIALGILGITFYIINIKVNWWLPLVLNIGSFILFFVFFLLTGELAIGGGDMKMIIVSMLFINSFKMFYYYLIFFAFVSLIGIVITYSKKQRSVRCGPYLGLALLFTLIYQNISINDGLFITALFMMTIISLSYLFLAMKGGYLFDEKIYSLY